MAFVFALICALIGILLLASILVEMGVPIWVSLIIIVIVSFGWSFLSVDNKK